MEELLKLEHLSLVSKICTELDNHYNMNDKDLAEFIIDLAEKNPSLDGFKKALSENGAEFADSFVENILRIIKHMKPKMAGGSKKTDKPGKESKTKVEKLAESFPFLSLPDKKAKDDVERKEEKKVEEKVDDVMAFLEAMAPSVKKITEEVEERKSSKSHKKSRHRSRSRSSSPKRRKRSRSRDRNDDRRRNRSSSREKRRSRSRDRSRRPRSRSTSRERYRRPDNPRTTSHVERAPPAEPEQVISKSKKV